MSKIWKSERRASKLNLTSNSGYVLESASTETYLHCIDEIKNDEDASRPEVPAQPEVYENKDYYPVDMVEQMNDHFSKLGVKGNS